MKQKFLRLLGYIVFNKKAFRNLVNQVKLIKLLKYFTDHKLVHLRVNLYHLTGYLSASFSTDEKRQSLFYHYSYLKSNFNIEQLKQLFNEGVECYTEHSETGIYSIILTGSSKLEYEGSLSLVLKLNGIKIAALSFTIVPGSLFGLQNKNTGYITCLQRVGHYKAIIRVAIKHFRDIIPAAILMRSFEAILAVLKIDSCAGIAYTSQLTAILNVNNENYYSFYDEQWLIYQGIYKNENYIIPLPLAQKPLLLIKQTHRNRTVKKRNKLKEIYDESFERVSAFVNNG